MKHKLDLSSYGSKELRLYQNIEYILVSDTPVIITTDPTKNKLYTKCIGNGTDEIFLSVQKSNLSDTVWILVKDYVIPVKFLYSEGFMSNHHEDITPEYINEEYPLFKKLMNYYFRYLELEFNPTDFIYNLDRYANIDTTFDEFKSYIFKEVLVEFPSKMAVDKTLLSKYVLQFYNRRGTEESIIFLLYVIFGKDLFIQRGRDTVLISSDAKQGILSKSSIVLQDNYMHQLYSYIINLEGELYSSYRDIVYKLVNPTGYLPFGSSSISSSSETEFAGDALTT